MFPCVLSAPFPSAPKIYLSYVLDVSVQNSGKGRTSAMGRYQLVNLNQMHLMHFMLHS